MSGRHRARVVGVVAVVVALLSPIAAGPAQADLFFIWGTCTLTIRADWSGDSVTLTTPDAGDCIVDLSRSGTADLGATVGEATAAPFTCMEAVGTGNNGAFSLSVGTGGIDFNGVRFALAKNGDIVELTFEKDTNLLGSGTFRQTPLSAEVCQQGMVPTGVVTWEGVLVFEDPSLE